MTRKEFLENIGLGAAFVLTATCMGGCTKDSAEGQNKIDFTIDLNKAAYAKLQTPGTYIVKDGVVIARSNSGEYLAATQTCSHEQLTQITYSSDEGGWLCTAHGALFDEEGNGLNANGSKGLTIYNTELLANNMLRVYG